jgi:SAM-dependent methyltransferase
MTDALAKTASLDVGGAMNRSHLDYLASDAWAQTLRTDLLPWLEQFAELDDEVLEIGPGPGLTTDLLRARAAAVTAVEIDESLATALKQRLLGTNVVVIEGNATVLGLPSDRYAAATCFSITTSGEYQIRFRAAKPVHAAKPIPSGPGN